MIKVKMDNLIYNFPSLPGYKLGGNCMNIPFYVEDTLNYDFKR